ncbi:hypothetical protein D3C71_1306650 [compost metagenome]
MAELTTMTQIKHASQEMQKLCDVGEYKQAAKIGANILDGFGQLSQIRSEALKVAFEEMKGYDFYQHVIKTAEEVLKRFS